MLHDGSSLSDKSHSKSSTKDAAVIYRRKMEDKRLRKQDQARTKARERRSNENQAILDLQYTLPMNGGLLRTVDKATVLRLTNRYMLLRYQLSQLLLQNRGSPLRAPVHRSLIVVTTERSTGSLLYVSPYLEHITRHPWYGMIGQPLSSYAVETTPWREGDLVRLRNNCPTGVKSKNGEKKVSELSVFRVVSSLSVVDLNFHLLHWLHPQLGLQDCPGPAPPLRYAFLTFHQHEWKIVRAHSRVFGLDESSLVGNSLFDCVHIDDIAPLYQALQRLGDKHTHVTTDCCRWKLGQGYVWVVIHASQITTDSPSRINFVCQHEIAHCEETPPELIRPPLIVDTSYTPASEVSGDVIEEGPVDWWHDECSSLNGVDNKHDHIHLPIKHEPLETSTIRSNFSGATLRRCSSSLGSTSSSNTLVSVCSQDSLTIPLPADQGHDDVTVTGITDVIQGTMMPKHIISELSTKSFSGSVNGPMIPGSQTSLLYRLLQNKEEEHSPVILHRSSSSTAGSLSPIDGGESCLEKMEVSDEHASLDSLSEAVGLDDCLAPPPLQSLFEDLNVESFFPSMLSDVTGGLGSDLDFCSADLSSEALLQDGLA